MDNEEIQYRKVNPNDVYESLKCSKFKQQKMNAWRPFPTLLSTVFIFSIFGIICLALGIVMLIYSKKIIEHKIEFKDDRPSIEFKIEEKMETPIAVYYEIHNFYQNHRRYVMSRSNEQMEDKKDFKDKSDIDSCKSAQTIKEMKYKGETGNNNVFNEDNDDKIAYPCGLIAKSYKYFDEHFTLKKENNEITINENNIAWKKDKELFKNLSTTQHSVQWQSFGDEHFIVWMRPSPFPDFRKLYGRINKTLEKGSYTLTINRTYSNIETKDKIEKYFVLTTLNKFGGKNYFLSITYIVFGSICILLTIAVIIYDKIYTSRKNSKRKARQNIVN